MVALLSACGGGGGAGDDGGGGPPAGTTTEYFPMALGDRWISRDTYTVGFITTRVTAVQTTGSTQDIELTRFTVDGQRTPIRLRRDAGGIYLLPNDDDPAYLRNLGPLLQMKLPVREGESYTQIPMTRIDLGQDLDGDNRNEVADISASTLVVGLLPVTLPDIGTLTNVAHLRTTLTLKVILSRDGQEQTVVTRSDDYYAPDIGPVKSDVTADGIGQLVFEEAIGYGVGTRRSETRPPVATQQTPAVGSASSPGTLIEIFFDEDLDAFALELAPPVLRRADGLIAPGRFELSNGRRLTFVRQGTVPSGVYTVDFAGGVSDVYGNVTALPAWTFTLDGDGPQLLSTSLANGATNVPLDLEILVTFSEPVVPDASAFTIGPAGFSGNYSLAPEIASADGRTLRLVRTDALNYATAYELTITASARDAVGNNVDTSSVIRFTTEAGRFAPAAALPVTSPVGSSAVADLTGDGRGDLVVATGFGNAADTDFRVLLLPALSDGSLGTPRELPSGSTINCRPFTVAVADMNADGRRDVLVWRENCGVRLMQQAADGSFDVAWDDASLDMERLVDVDGDGRPDIVSRGSGVVRLNLGLPDGRFGPALELPTPNSTAFTVADTNGDGLKDIVGVGDSIAVLRQRAGGSFAAAEVLAFGSGRTSTGVAVGDINGDGRADVVFSLQNGSLTEHLAWQLQQADGTLGAIQLTPSPARPSAVELADLDGDGRLDVVLGHDTTGLLSVALQRSDGKLGPFESFLLPTQSFLQQKDLVVGDFSGDGRPDVLVDSLAYRQLAPPSGSARRGPQAAKPTPLTASIEALRGPSAASPPGR